MRHTPHCLSRALVIGEKKELFQSRINATALERVLNQPTYSDFQDNLEASVHNALPQYIMGDCYYSTAPNGNCFSRIIFEFPPVQYRHLFSDPVFFLHHPQVDHLWWVWCRKIPLGGCASIRDLGRAQGCTKTKT